MSSPRGIRGRYVKSEFWADKELWTQMDASERLCYIGLWAYADDAGWLAWDAEAIGAALYRYTAFKEREALVERTLAALLGMGKAKRYACGHVHLTSMGKHLTSGRTSQPVFEEHQLQCKRNRKSPKGIERNRIVNNSQLTTHSNTHNSQHRAPAREGDDRSKGPASAREALLAAGVNADLLEPLADSGSGKAN